MRVRAVVLAAALVLAPLGARAADLVVWWEKGWNPEEDEAVHEIIAAFERKTGKRVELALLAPQGDLPGRTAAAVEAGRPPDLVYGTDVAYLHFARWAHEGRLADLAEALGPLADQFDRDTLDQTTQLDATTGRRGLHALPVGRVSNHIHVWKSLLEQAGFTLADVPKEWDAFWSFWCDKVQPAVRRATGRDDLYGLGLSMAALPAGDTDSNFLQFVAAYEADYVTRDGRLVIDEPAVQAGLVEALDGYTALYRKGCIPPDAAGWENYGNNKAFLERRVVMTVNTTLSIPGELRATRPEDYSQNTATLAWPSGARGQPLAVVTQSSQAAVFRSGGHEATAEEFVRFLVGEGWLAHWLDFAGDRYLPPMPALLGQPFWLDPSDPHRMVSAMQFLTRPHDYSYAAVSGEWRHQLVQAEGVWPKAVHRVAVEGVSPEQAADEAVARIKQILSE
jgi:multiple sugar transport system substrate-binding protein